MDKQKKLLFLIAGLVLVTIIWAAVTYWPFGAINPYSYSQIRLGMSEDEIAAIIGLPAEQYCRARHVGGITSPGHCEVLSRECGLAYRDLPQRYGQPAANGKNVILRQWWGKRYVINVAFDDDGRAVGIYLMEQEPVNW